MIKMVDDIGTLNGKTIKEIRYQRDDDYNQGVLINTTDGDICFFVGGIDDDHDIWTQTIAGLSRFNVKNALEMGVITQEEHDAVLEKDRNETNRMKVGHALRLMDELQAEQPQLLVEFAPSFKERIPNE